MFRYRVCLTEMSIIDNVVVYTESDVGSFDSLPDASEATRNAISAISEDDRIHYTVTIFDSGKPSGPFKI